MSRLDKITTHLRASLADEVLSKQEKRSIKDLLLEYPLDKEQMNILRNTIYQLAGERITNENSKFVLEWVKNVTNALTPPASENAKVLFSPGDECRNAIT